MSFGLQLRTPPLVAFAIGLAGVGIEILSVISLRRARTTVNPMKPERTSVLVTGHAYKFSRNPMYVGLLFVLVAVAVFLNSAWALAGPLLFVLYMDRFQISHEERVLSATFGAAYSTYRSRVRRWL
ncbi:isoprenylcysteine carboxylmethyltransferase family protein [bacterium]|nr:isoprenylcysteine carboxylmethyltransferase family protein [bacterium]